MKIFLLLIITSFFIIQPILGSVHSLETTSTFHAEYKTIYILRGYQHSINLTKATVNNYLNLFQYWPDNFDYINPEQYNYFSKIEKPISGNVNITFDIFQSRVLQYDQITYNKTSYLFGKYDFTEIDKFFINESKPSLSSSFIFILNKSNSKIGAVYSNAIVDNILFKNITVEKVVIYSGPQETEFAWKTFGSTDPVDGIYARTLTNYYSLNTGLLLFSSLKEFYQYDYNGKGEIPVYRYYNMTLLSTNLDQSIDKTNGVSSGFTTLLIVYSILPIILFSRKKRN